MNAFEKNFRFRTGTIIGNSPILFPINYYRSSYKEKIISLDSDCCIEGFQRSGNSFFILLFKRKNKTTKLAHHTHAAAQIIKAVKYNVPTIVLIRNPIDVIASLLAWDDKLKISTALDAYIQFHQKILPFNNDYMLVDFEAVIAKPALVVNAFNERFGTQFILPEFSDEQLQKIKAGVRARNEASMAPLPTPEKEKLKELFKIEIKKSPKLLQARQLYDALYVSRQLFS